LRDVVGGNRVLQRGTHIYLRLMAEPRVSQVHRCLGEPLYLMAVWPHDRSNFRNLHFVESRYRVVVVHAQQLLEQLPGLRIAQGPRRYGTTIHGPDDTAAYRLNIDLVRDISSGSTRSISRPLCVKWCRVLVLKGASTDRLF
jgi:hypothetical protein